MTNEQVKQNAEAYAMKVAESHIVEKRPAYVAAFNAFMSGAHSRDKEINELKAKVFELSWLKLRNPWMSVKELPIEGQDVLICMWTGCVIRNSFMSIDDINHMKNNPECYKCWMPTPRPKNDN